MGNSKKKSEWTGPKDIHFIKDPEERRIQLKKEVDKLIEKHKKLLDKPNPPNELF